MTVEKYLKDHGLDPAFVKENLGWNWTDKKITIPIYDKDGTKLFEKYRHLTGDIKFSFEKGGKPTLYPYWFLENEQELYLCEGEPDAAKLWQEKLPAITTIGGVESFSQEMAAELAGRTVKLVLDSDEAGQKSIPKYIAKLEAIGARVQIINLPKDTKDVSEYLVKYGVSRFKNLTSADPETWLINKYSTIYPIIPNDEFLSKDYPNAGWLIKPLINAVGLILIVGEGGVGKTLLSYSLAKSITEHSDWLGKYPAAKNKVLILDKENEAGQIKRNLYAQQATSDDILHYTTANEFSFFGERDNPSEEAMYLNAYIKRYKIGVVVLDSFVDFFAGNENDSTDAADNILAWRQTFPNTAIIVLQHENKPAQGVGKRFSGHRVRGSTHIVNAAQSILSFSVPDRDNPDQIMVEHTKVRDGRKQNPFLIEMNIEPDPNNPEETIVTDFTYKGEIVIQKKKEEEARSAILELLASQPKRKFTSKDIEIELSDKIDNIKNIQTALPYLRENFLVANTKKGRSFLYWNLDSKSSEEVDNFIDEITE